MGICWYSVVLFYEMQQFNSFPRKRRNKSFDTVRERFEWLFFLFNLNSDLLFADYIVNDMTSLNIQLIKDSTSLDLGNK